MFIITILLFIIGILLCLDVTQLYNKDNFSLRERILKSISKEKTIEFFSGIIVTILGVTISILMTNSDVKSQDKSQTIEFLNTVQTELSTKALFIGNMLQNLQNNNNSEAVLSTIKIVPISPILSMEVLLSDSPYNSTISSYCYSALLSGRFNFSIQQTRIQNSTDNDKILIDLLFMVNELERSCKIIDIELEYQEGQIDEDEIYNKMDVIIREPFVIDVTQYGFSVDEIIE